MVEEKIDWFCPKCNSYVSSESVTFEETHQICNTGVILKELNQNKMTAVETNDNGNLKLCVDNPSQTIESKPIVNPTSLNMEIFNFICWIEKTKDLPSEDGLTKGGDGYQWYNSMWGSWLKERKIQEYSPEYIEKIVEMGRFIMLLQRI